MTAVSAADRQRLLEQWGLNVVGDRRDALVHQLFEEQAREAPDRIALVFEAEQLTYAALDERATRLARRLSSLGVTARARVGLCVHRSLDSVVALVAILKVGAAYVPLEPTMPKERLAFLVEDAGVAVVLSHRDLEGQLPSSVRVVLLDGPEPAMGATSPDGSAGVAPAVHADDVAYVMYTSGSTGTPKGVEVVHRAIHRLVRKVDYVRLGPDEVLLHAAPLAFDASTFEIWGALLNGGRVVVYPDAVPTARGLADAISRHGVTTMWLTAALFNALVDEAPACLRGLRQLLTGGEALSVAHVRRALDALPDTTLINGYGPTETTTFAVCHTIPRPLPEGLSSIPIGRPIRDTSLYVLDANRQLVPIGDTGELHIGGDGLARGYLARPELTAERFVENPFRAGERLYRTGDLVRFLPDGTLEYQGRTDDQVKIRGFRIELGEIEAHLSGHPGIASSAVLALDAPGGGKRLVAYAVPSGERPTVTALRDFLKVSLPDYMIPTAFVWVEKFPITPNGKLDRRALPPPPSDRPALAEEYVAPETAREKLLCTLWGELLGLGAVGVLDNFFDLGGNSLMALRFVGRLRAEHSVELSVLQVFEFPTARELARALDSEGEQDGLVRALERAEAQVRKASSDRIAIVGMAGRYPGAATVEALWELLRGGRDAITVFRDEDLDPAVPEALRKDPSYVKARGILTGVDQFDAGFFGISPREAEIMDPQQRVLLEVAWEALESSGHVPESFDGSIGVFAGKYNDSYWSENVVTRPDLVASLGAFQAMVANEKDYIATRIAHKLDLTGPAVSIHTACSTSLVAICQAVRSLRVGECDLALAGGVSITVPVNSGYLYQEGYMLSNDGRTRTFDAQAAGTVFSDGAGLVVLRRLDDALRDGDTVFAVISGVALNNDGGKKASFTAPSVLGQAKVIAMAHADAGVDPRSISYVEAHGTATPLGDPIEVEALTRAFRLKTKDAGFCALGSVKSNIGHTVIAAGVAGVIKTALALSREVVPANANFTTPNPKIPFEGSPFRVLGEPLPWPRAEAPRRAGVSSFGVGGTNAHVVLEEAPVHASSAPGRPGELLLLSARSPAALDSQARALGEFLRSSPETSLGDVAFTLHAGRRRFPHRRAVVARDVAQASELLRAEAKGAGSKTRGQPEPSVVFMFPGQGAQYVGMGRTLYESEPVFRERVDHCAERLREPLGCDLRALMFPAEGDDLAAAASLKETRFTQPALFTIGIALAALLESFGVQPKAMIGHSIGEFACAVLAGVMSLDDALRLVAARGKLMFDLAPGSMLSVRLPAEKVRERLGPTLAVASDNGPALCVVAGPTDRVAELEAELTAEGVVTRQLHTSHAFHSSMMDPVVGPFTRVVESVTLSAPRIPFVSTLTGTWIKAEEARDPAYWARHLRETVRFAEGVRTLWKEPNVLLLEVGPRATLSTLARQQITDRAQQVAVASMCDTATPEAEWGALLGALGELWVAGVPLEATALYRHPSRRRIALPTTHFERKRYWIDPASVPAVAVAAAPSVEAPVTLVPEQAPPPVQEIPTVSESPSRIPEILAALAQVFEEASGIELTDADADVSFLDLGLDSLVLTQVALSLQKKFPVKITFRQLLEQVPSLRTLAEHMNEQLPPDVARAPAPAATAPVVAPMAGAPRAAAAPAPAAMVPAFLPVGSPTGGGAPVSTLEHVIQEQLRLMAAQLSVLQGGAALPAVAAVAAVAATVAEPAAASPRAPAVVASRATPAASGASAGNGAPPADAAAELPPDAKKPFGAIARITTQKTEELTPKQRARLEAFTRRYTTRTAGSKKWTTEHRPMMADPRVVTGFRPGIKELIYPIVIERSQGARLWDLDGNEYVDTLNGFGCNLFGWQPEFVTKAVERQLRIGHEIGPQTPLAGDCAKLICELTGFDRAAFCNTGSEAVMGTMRVARTVTGRSKIALFAGSYHGIFDEVIVRGNKKLKSFPAAPGIMPSTAENVMVLDYGTPETLDILKAHAHELAAVLVEPVQSRRPDFQPREFLKSVRELTEKSGTVLIFDEVITGFRTCPGGAQEHFGVRADLASYGKVIGGGFPVGVIAGKRAYMDALDGGQWEFGDASVPTVGVTYFAGTFVRHPLALAAVKAVLTHLKDQGPSLQRETNAKTERLARELNAFFQTVEAPLEIRHFGSLWKTFPTEDHAFGDLLFCMLRDRGVHILDGFPCFFTTAHGDAEVDFIIREYKAAVIEMQESGFFPEPKSKGQSAPAFDATRPPAPGAKLGRDAQGNPAWFVPNPAEPGKYVRVGEAASGSN